MTILFATVIAAIAVLSLVTLSPFFLREIGRIQGTNWAEVGNIGQAYGGASALLAGIALVGVSASLVIQARQSKAERIRSLRTHQMELSRIVLHDPEIYAPVLGGLNDSTTDELRRSLFTGMWVNYARMGYQMGIITEYMLRDEIFPILFAIPAGRKWWTSTGQYGVRGGTIDRLDRRFFRIANEEYYKAVTAGPPAALSTADERVPNPNVMSRRSSGMPIGMILGVAVGFFLRSRLLDHAFKSRQS